MFEARSSAATFFCSHQTICRSLTRCVDSASSLKELLHWKQVVRGPFPHKRPDVHCNRRKVCAAHPKAPGLAFFASGPRPRLIIRIGSRLQPCYLIGLLLCMTLTSRMRAGSPDLSSIASGPPPEPRPPHLQPPAALQLLWPSPTHIIKRAANCFVRAV